jgi:hypothetical protein
MKYCKGILVAPRELIIVVAFFLIVAYVDALIYCNPEKISAEFTYPEVNTVFITRLNFDSAQVQIF